MSCPNWPDLVAARQRASDAGFESHEQEWRQALEHRRDCVECQSEAMAADPLVLFERLPSIELGPSEIDEMRQRVAGARRLLESPRAQDRPGDRRGAELWTRGLAAALFLALALAVVWPGLDSWRDSERLSRQETAEQLDALELADAAEAKLKLAEHLSMLPPVEADGVILQLEAESFYFVVSEPAVAWQLSEGAAVGP